MSPPDTRPRRLSWIEFLASLLVQAVGRLLLSTYRFTVVNAEGLASEEPRIFTFWHNQLVGCGWLLYRRLVRRGKPLVLIVSLSRDGEVTARAAARTGFLVARGSSNKGGLGALRTARKFIKNERASVLTAADGSQGPIYECQPGTIVLSQVTGAPVVPMAFATRHSWRVRSWDRLVIPRPFSKIFVLFGEPQVYPSRLSTAELEQAAADLKQQLDRLAPAVERELG
jgi:lysophospholipid acyltransferase (LPLAT)-like uncharacterized protein